MVNFVFKFLISGLFLFYINSSRHCPQFYLNRQTNTIFKYAGDNQVITCLINLLDNLGKGGQSTSKVGKQLEIQYYIHLSVKFFVQPVAEVFFPLTSSLHTILLLISSYSLLFYFPFLFHPLPLLDGLKNTIVSMYVVHDNSSHSILPPNLFLPLTNLD